MKLSSDDLIIWEILPIIITKKWSLTVLKNGWEYDDRYHSIRPSRFINLEGLIENNLWFFTEFHPLRTIPAHAYILAGMKDPFPEVIIHFTIPGTPRKTESGYSQFHGSHLYHSSREQHGHPR